MSLMMLNCDLTDNDSGVAPSPCRAAITSRASACLPFRMRRRGESGRNGHSTYISKVKKTWKASGNLQATLPGANENPSVNQFEMENPVIQLALFFFFL